MLAVILRDSVLARHKDLREAAARVEFSNAKQHAIRVHLKSLRSALSAVSEGETLTFTPLIVRDYAAGEAPTRSARPVSKTHAAWTNYVETLEGILRDAEEEEKLGNMEIQDLMSRYNMAEQLAGSKMDDDDTDLSVIQKI